MTILGIIVAMVIAILISLVLGSYGILVVISITFGFVLSTHIRTKEIHADLQRIKEKLGIEEKDDFNMTNEEIEAELANEQLIENEIDGQIINRNIANEKEK